MSSILDSLTLADTTRKQALPPHIALRQKLIQAVDQQIAGATAEISGQTYSKKVERFITDPTTGERTKAKVDGKFRRWWWTNEAGKVLLEIRYANKPLEIKPNKRVIEIGTIDHLIPTLERVKVAVNGGELDKALNAALALRRKELKGNKQKQV